MMKFFWMLLICINFSHANSFKEQCLQIQDYIDRQDYANAYKILFRLLREHRNHLYLPGEVFKFAPQWNNINDHDIVADLYLTTARLYGERQQVEYALEAYQQAIVHLREFINIENLMAQLEAEMRELAAQNNPGLDQELLRFLGTDRTVYVRRTRPEPIRLVP